jgi:hypothetical protein
MAEFEYMDKQTKVKMSRNETIEVVVPTQANIKIHVSSMGWIIVEDMSRPYAQSTVVAINMEGN